MQKIGIFMCKMMTFYLISIVALINNSFYLKRDDLASVLLLFFLLGPKSNIHLLDLLHQLGN